MDELEHAIFFADGKRWDLDDIIPKHESAPHDWSVVRVARGDMRPLRPLKAWERKALKALADAIVTHRLYDVLCSPSIEPLVDALVGKRWRWIMSDWLETFLQPGLRRRRPQITDQFKFEVRANIAAEILRNPDRQVKEIRGAVAKLMRLSDERIKQLAPPRMWPDLRRGVVRIDSRYSMRITKKR
jgi:hypothetical protein